jgi:hypothetical protein
MRAETGRSRGVAAGRLVFRRDWGVGRRGRVEVKLVRVHEGGVQGEGGGGDGDEVLGRARERARRCGAWCSRRLSLDEAVVAARPVVGRVVMMWPWAFNWRRRCWQRDRIS